MKEVKKLRYKDLIAFPIHSPSLVHTHKVVCLNGANATPCHTSSLLFTAFRCSRLLLLTGEHLVLEVWLNAAHG